MISIASIRTSLVWRVKMLVQDDKGDWSSCFLIKDLFSAKGIRFDESRDSLSPNRTSITVKDDTIVEAPYVTDSPNSDNFPAMIAPTKKAHAERAKYIPKTELMRSGFDTAMSLIIT